MKNKIISAADAIALVKSSDVLSIAGFVGVGVPDELLIALEKRFLSTGSPANLTLMFTAGPGDGAERGLNKLAYQGLIKRTIGGHYGLVPKLGSLATSGKIEAYNFPQGIISQLYRDIAAGKPGILSRVGIGTFVDPRIQGGKVNENTTEDLIEVITLAGEELLFYKSIKINVAFIRGTSADPKGNISMEREALRIDNLAQAMAAKNSGGLVIAQVEKIVEQGSLNPRIVEIPGVMVDAVVVARSENHVQTYATIYSPYLDGHARAPDDDTTTPTSLDFRKVICRRAALELQKYEGVINLGIGVPEGVASVAREEGWLDKVTLSAEPGVIGGQPSSGLDFGTAVNTDVIITQNQQFDFYDGGGLSLAVLGMAQVGATGDVNVSRFGSRLMGAGGFINISQNAKNLIFCGAFTSGGLKINIVKGSLDIEQEGKIEKFVNHVDQITFSGDRASQKRQSVLYVTERCVFELLPNGLKLIEVAPGINIERDILRYMSFKPLVENPQKMHSHIFVEGPMSENVMK
ncbi:MAG: malonate decarboxylase subunit alpha [Planktomarina sp.]|nr:malonate decarboxylase subunit alpha [Planktomarina sp.]